MKLSAETRTSVKSNHALIAPDGWVGSQLPGWTDSQVHVIISSTMGAKFTQLLVFKPAGETASIDSGADEYFIYVMEGEGSIRVDSQEHQLMPGSYLYIPPAASFQVSCQKTLKLTVFIKKYQELEGHATPVVIAKSAQEIEKETYLDDPLLQMQVLLPDDPRFDMAVNIFTYHPGGQLPFVETHVMEHGLIYLSGQGIYRLANDWYPVRTDDCIWMAPYCPQWFGALGKEPAVYLYYKDVNRQP